MPELPEVETMRRGIAGVAGCRIEGVDVPRTGLQPIQIAPALPALRRRLVGRRIEAVDRLGKRVVLVLDSGQRLIIEPRMTGRVLLDDPPNRSHLRLVLRLSGGSQRQLLFWDVRGLGVVRLLTAEELLAQLGPQKLGPDALEISADETPPASFGQPPPDQGRAVGPAGLGGHRQPLRLRDPTPRRPAPAARLPPASPSRLGRLDRLGPRSAARGHRRSGLDALRRDLPQRPQPGRRISTAAPRLSAARQAVPGMRPRRGPADRPGAAIDILLSDLPAAATKVRGKHAAAGKAMTGRRRNRGTSVGRIANPSTISGRIGKPSYGRVLLPTQYSLRVLRMNNWLCVAMIDARTIS